jgi:hypothetical protein
MTQVGDVFSHRPFRWTKKLIMPVMCLDSGLDGIHDMPNVQHSTLVEDATTPNTFMDFALIDHITLETSHISSD